MAESLPSPARGGSPLLAGLISRALADGADSGAINALSEHLHRDFAPGLSRHIARLSGAGPDSDRVQELTQRTWVAFWEAVRARRYDPAKSAPSTFMYAIAHVIVLRERRSAAREVRRAESRSELAISSESRSAEISEALGLADQIERVRAALTGREGVLTPDERTTLRMIGQGATDRELATLLGVSPSTAHQRKKTALARFAEWLSAERAGGPSAAVPNCEQTRGDHVIPGPKP